MTGPILVTGATGLLGRAVAAGLGGRVVATSRTAQPGYRAVDLADAVGTRRLLAEVRPAVVVHLAGSRTGDEDELYRANVLTTRNVLRAALELPETPMCIVAGSAAEYGGAEGVITEATPLRPVSAYGRAKAAMTAEALELADATGCRVTVLRPFNVVAPGMAPASALGNMRGQLLAGSGPRRTVRCGRLDVVRDFVPAALLVEVVAGVVAGRGGPAVVNVCTGVGTALGELLAAMGRALGVEVDAAVDPELAELPAPDRVVGDPELCRTVAAAWSVPTVDDLARIALSGAGT